MVRIRRVQTEAEYDDALSVRFSVFVDEQGIDPDLEVDDKEDEAIHFVAYENATPIGAARLRSCETNRFDRTVAKVERVAVLEAYREQGVGRSIMNELEDTAREQGHSRAILHSQVRSTAFYRALGYEQVGDLFEEAGIPHVAMEKPL